MLTTNRENMIYAAKSGHAILAVNTQGGNFDTIWTVCKAAEELEPSVILAHYVNMGAYSGHDRFVEVCRWCANKVPVLVSIHLDHGVDFGIRMEALKLGSTPVMIDGSTKPIEENAIMTNEVIKVVRCFDVPVEAETGELLRPNNLGTVMENKNIVDPEKVRWFLELCQLDSLAIDTGSAHECCRGGPDIHLDVLKMVKEFMDIPLVLHGCTGTKEEAVKEAIKPGAVRINFDTEIWYKHVEYYEEGLRTLNHQGHSRKLPQLANEKLQEDMKKTILLAGPDGKVEAR